MGGSWARPRAAELRDAPKDQVEVGLPAGAVLGGLPAALDRVAVPRDGRGEALGERLAVAPQLPHTVADAHLVNAADVPLVGVELEVAAVGGVASDHADAVRRLGQLDRRALDQQPVVAPVEPLEGDAGLARPGLPTGRDRLLLPLAHQDLELLERL